MKIEIKRGQDKQDPELIPTRFKQFVHRKGKKRGNLNTLSKEAKVIAALTIALAIQGKRDKKNYYVAGDTIWCPEITETGKTGNCSYKATGRFKIGKVGESLTFGIMQFSIKFRDSKDEMGLPDLTIEEASIHELNKATPLHG